MWKVAVKALYFCRYLSVFVHYGVLRGKRGLEIGGPSPNFQDGVLPVYPFVAGLDGCNFAETTIWGGAIKEGWNFKYYPGRKAGYQFICDATDLSAIPPETYDFVLASHVIEHIANPVKALRDWIRVLKKDGVLLLMVPHRDGVSEQLRPLTTLKHLVEDFTRGVREDDPAHVPELLEWLDSRTDAPASEIAAYKNNLRNFHDNRALHHHVFSTYLAAALVNYAGMKILSVRNILPCHIVVLAKKVADPETAVNVKFLGPRARYKRASPFPSDRIAEGTGVF